MYLFRDPPNFSMAEFIRSATARTFRIDNTVPEHLIPNAYKTLWMLQEIRNYLNKVTGEKLAILITSGFRCDELNRKVGGAAGSRHTLALAVDFVVPGMDTERVFELLKQMPNIRFHKVINEFGSWIHLSMTNEIPDRKFLVATKKDGKVIYKEVA